MTPERRERERARKRAYYHANKERMKSQNRAWVKANRERANEIARTAYHRKDKAKIAERSRLDRARNPETNRKATRNWREKNRDKQRALIAEWSRRNPERRRAHAAKRRALVAASPATFTVEQWLEIVERYGHRCAYCQRKPRKLTMDHVVPLAKGGTHTDDNIVPACFDCNRRKHVKSAAEFLIERGFV